MLSQQAIPHLSHRERQQLVQVYDNCKYNDKKKRPSFLYCKLQDEDRENIAELQDHQKI